MRATLGGVEVEVDPPGTPLYWPESGLLGLDVESTYLTDRAQFDPAFRVRTVQLATTRSAMVLDLADPAQRAHAEELLADPAYTFCSHSNMDVLSVAAEFGIDITARNIDTLSLAQMVRTDKAEKRDLKTLARDYGMPELQAADDELYAWMRETWVAAGGRKNSKRADIEAAGWNTLAGPMPSSAWPEVFTRYAGLDAIACRRLVELLIPATDAPPELLRVEQWLDTASNRIQLRGMRVDTDRVAELLDETRSVNEAAHARGSELSGVNIGGPKLLDWLGQHGVDWSRWDGAWTPTGSPSITKETVKLLGDFPLDPVAREVVDCLARYKGSLDLLRKTTDIAKRSVTYADGITRIHPNLSPRGATTTARMSSSAPNVQNFSKKDARHRGLFLPEPGHTLVSIDFDQVELRVVAALAREQVMIDAVHDGVDLHDLTQAELAEAGVEIDRQTAKMTNFLIVYGGGSTALHEQGGIPVDIAQRIIAAFRQRYQAIEALRIWLGYERDAIRTISNRRLPVTANKAGDLRTYASINYAVQSAARELLVDAWRRFEVDFGHAGIVWLPIHDELILQIPGAPGEAEFDRVVADAERAMRLDFMGVPITATAVPLLDEHGVSRWMPGDLAEKIAKEKAA